MAAPTDVLNEGLSTARAELKALDTNLAALRADFAVIEAQFGFLKWIGTVFTAVLIAVVAGAGNVVWSASALNAKVEQQGIRLDRMDAKLDLLLQRTLPPSPKEK